MQNRVICSTRDTECNSPPSHDTTRFSKLETGPCRMHTIRKGEFFHPCQAGGHHHPQTHWTGQLRGKSWEVQFSLIIHRSDMGYITSRLHSMPGTDAMWVRSFWRW
ncbi:hypothetical protein VTN02DRAFT_4945 [Thermoascus thermophilus]